MYKHLLVPLDDSELSICTVDKAVEFARSVGARVSFFTARPDYAATGDGILERTMAPENFALNAAGDARGILAKAEAAARAAGVEFTSMVTTSDRPYEAIIDAAENNGCDLIFMASHGRRGVRGLFLGSQTQRVLAHTRLPVLVATVVSNLRSPHMDSAIAIIQNEHRSLAAVMHAMQHLVREQRAGRGSVEPALLEAMLTYILEIPVKLHHPKEETYLFAHLAVRTDAANAAIAELSAQHRDEPGLIAALKAGITAWESGTEQGFEQLGQAVDRYAEQLWTHMNLEEKVIIPLAREHLTERDWLEIDRAFSENGDPRFDENVDSEYKKLFSRIMNWAAIH
jgi:nucleotide-binding universal stress UspA family protein/hemerythrin-like domain-containing protein